MSARVYPRRFDWDEARRLHSEGMLRGEIARRLGVSYAAVDRVVNPQRALGMAATRARQQTSGTCVVCGGPCSHNPSARTIERCCRCASLAQATSVRPCELRCSFCGEWLPDDAFARSSHANLARRGRRGTCRDCDSARRRAYRELHPEAREREAAQARARRATAW